MSQNNQKPQAPADKTASAPAQAPKNDKVTVRALKDCFIHQLRFPGEVFTVDKKEVTDANGKLLPHFEEVQKAAKSKRIDDIKTTENPYGVPPALRGQDKES